MVSRRGRFFAAVVIVGVLAACGARTGTASGNSADASVANDAKADAVEPAVCDPPKERGRCFTKAELWDMWNHPPRGGDSVDAGAPPFDPMGCLPRNVVRDDCCNVAVTGPQPSSGDCCYTFCTGSCC